MQKAVNDKVNAFFIAFFISFPFLQDIKKQVNSAGCLKKTIPLFISFIFPFIFAAWKINNLKIKTAAFRKKMAL